MKHLAGLLLALTLLLATPVAVQAQLARPQLFKATVIDAQPPAQQVTPPHQQQVTVEFTEAGNTQQVTINHGDMVMLTPQELVNAGDTVVLQAIKQTDQTLYYIVDYYRLPVIATLAVFFILVVVISAGKKGLGALVGMGISLVVILQFIIPQILNGANPLIISIVGSVGIITITLFLAHGFNKPTLLSWISTLISLIFVGLLATIAVELARLTGAGTEDANSLRIGITEGINLQGLFLGGIIIGALGVLDDITTSQTAIVIELKNANPKLNTMQLIKQARRVGTEHIASLVNTLVMAYAGVAMPILILLVINPHQWPQWAILNSPIIAEEIVRTIAGSTGLILAVPISTFITAWYVQKNHLKSKHTHHH